jgi:multidrug resistance efflux pump
MFKIARMAPEGKQLQPGEMIMELDSQELRQKMADYQAEKGRLEEELRRRHLEYDVQFKDLKVAVEEARVKAATARHKLLAPPEVISAHDRRLFTIERDQADQDAELLGAKGAAVERMATAELRSLETTFDQVRLRVQQTQARMDACTVKAPIAGTLVYKVMSSGAKRKVGEQTCHHEIIVQIPDMSTLRLNAVIDESFSSKVMPGQRVRVRVDALPDQPIAGKVKSVGSILRMKRFDMPVKVVDAVIELEDVRSKLTPGMTATGQVEIERASGVLMIPLEFVRQSEGRPIVRVPVLKRQAGRRSQFNSAGET